MPTPDPLAALLELAKSVAHAKQVTAEASSAVNSAKMAQIKANQDAADVKARHDMLDAAEKALSEKTKAHEAAVAEYDEKVAKHNADAAVLVARTKEVAANEARALEAIASAREWEAKAKSYEGMAYAKLETVRKKLGEAEVL